MKDKILKCHYSLLPAFNTEEPVRDAMLAGVKVTGVTFYYEESGRIIAQYPIFITNDMHYEDVVQQLAYLEQALRPLIMEKIANNEQIELKSMLKQNECGGNCKGCGGCKS